MRPSKLLAILVLVLGCGSIAAQRPFIDEAEPITPKSVKPGRKWAEGEVRLPAWPQARNLVEIKTDTPSQRFTHYLDSTSLSTGDDGVVRYTIVTESASGARNVTFEGLRCTPRGHYKVYAYGADGRFHETIVAEQWQDIDERGDEHFRIELWRHYLCTPRLFKARPREEQIRLLRSGRIPEIENRGFLTN